MIGFHSLFLGRKRRLWPARPLGLLMALALLLCAALPALAERRVALVFGLDAYTELRPLQNAGNDARTIAGILRSAGFQVEVETDRDLRRMRRALEDFEADHTGADVALIFYAGHGVEIGGENLILPVDADPSSPESLRSGALPLAELQAIATRMAKLALILVDACREDPFDIAATGGGRSGKPLSQRITAEVKPAMGRMGNAQNTIFAFASAPGAVAADGTGGNSPFTSALARYLPTPGIEIRSALTLIQQEVYDRTRGRQLPYVESGLPQMFFMAEPAGPGGMTALDERGRLLLAMAGLDDSLRGEVEAIAGELDVPLAPLYGAMLAADLGHLGAEDRRTELRNAARSYAETLAQLQGLASTDPRVAELRGDAERALALGEFELARTSLDRAVKLDIGAIDELQASLERRVLSAAASLYAKAGVAMTTLDSAGAIAALEEALALLARIDPVPLGFDDWLVYEGVAGTLGRLHYLTGNLARAEEVYRAWLALTEARWQRWQDIDNERSIGVIVDHLGAVLEARGDDAGALAAYRRGLEISQRQYDRDPDDPLYRRDLSVALVKIGDMLRGAADYPGAEAQYRRAKELAETVALVPGVAVDFQRDPVSILGRIGDVLLDQNRLTEALDSFEEMLKRAQQLHRDYPEETEVTRDLYIAWSKLSEVAFRARSFDAATESARQALEVVAELAARDPANTQWQRDLALSHSRLGDGLAALSDQSGARAEFEKALAVLRRLAELDTDSVAAQIDLAMILNRLGDAEGLDNARDAARLNHEEALAIWRVLTGLSPADPVLQQSLMMGLVKLSFVHPAPMPLLDEAVVIAETLTEAGVMPAWQMDWPQFIRDVMGTYRQMESSDTEPGPAGTGTAQDQPAGGTGLDPQSSPAPQPAPAPQGGNRREGPAAEDAGTLRNSAPARQMNVPGANSGTPTPEIPAVPSKRRNR